MALENEALFLKKAVHAGVLDADKGTAALWVYSQLRQRGAQFSFGEFLVERGLLSSMALAALEDTSGRQIQTVSSLGDFDLIELIGEGHSGAVYRALQRTLDRPVALKILNANITSDPEALQRFQNEARATAKLNHPHVVQGIVVGCEQGLHYFAMELVDGGSARTLMQEAGGKLDETTALRIVQQAAEGLKAAHAAGLIHRDLKPDNILLSAEGQAKLADLGVSQSVPRQTRPTLGRSGRPLAQAPAPPHPTLSPLGRGQGEGPAGGETPGIGAGEFWASAPYAAPEVILGAAENDPRSDIYSLGATLFELLAGQPPYAGGSPQEVFQAHLGATVPDLQALRPDVSIQTANLVKRMLAKKPEERPSSAAAIAEIIARLLAARPRSQPPAPPAAAPPKVVARPSSPVSSRPPAPPAAASPKKLLPSRVLQPLGGKPGLQGRPSSGIHPALPPQPLSLSSKGRGVRPPHLKASGAPRRPKNWKQKQ